MEIGRADPPPPDAIPASVQKSGERKLFFTLGPGVEAPCRTRARRRTDWTSELCPSDMSGGRKKELPRKAEKERRARPPPLRVKPRGLLRCRGVE